MKHLHLELSSLPDTMQTHMHAAADKLAELQKKIPDHYNAAYSFAYSFEDAAYLRAIEAAVQEKKALKPAILVLIGIGGSNLGTRAVQQALLGSGYNEHTQNTKIYYADTVDAAYTADILALTESALKKGATILLNVVSKSGKTTESIALFELFLAQLKRYHPNDYARYIVCTTDNDSPLHTFATKHSWTTLTIPAQVGGRYSVLTAVGLFPLGLIGIDVTHLLQGASAMRTACLGKQSPALETAAWLYGLMQRGYHLYNLFLFSNELRGCGDWWRQLVGESLGKALRLDGRRNTQPIVPIVSIGTTDLHSVGQLYFADIARIATQFITIDKQPDLTLPAYAEFEQLIAHIQGKKVGTLMHAISTGVEKTYSAKHLPYSTLTIDTSAFAVGQLLMLKMFETVFLAHLLEVNAFDQPEVEDYKQQVRDILEKE